MDLEKWQGKFIKHLEEKGKTFNTVKNYRHDLEGFKKYYQNLENPFHLNDFNTKRLKDFEGHLYSKSFSQNSLRRKIQTLRIFFDYLVEKKEITDNPLRKLPSAKKVLDLPRPAKYYDLIKLWECLQEESKSANSLESFLGLRNTLVFLLIYGSGLQVSQLANLSKNQISLGKNNRVLLHPDKRESYSIPLVDSFYGPHKAYLSALKKIDLFSHQLLFFSANHYTILTRGLSARGVEAVFEEYRKKLRIRVTPKNLRQAAIYRWIHQGHSESLIKEWLGVAPSYTIKDYLETKNQYIYDENFLAND